MASSLVHPLSASLPPPTGGGPSGPGFCPPVPRPRQRLVSARHRNAVGGKDSYSCKLYTHIHTHTLSKALLMHALHHAQDPIELGAATAVFGAPPAASPAPRSHDPVSLLSSKSWLGHAEPAAGTHACTVMVLGMCSYTGGGGIDVWWTIRSRIMMY